jgi:hypothetical protein
MCGVYTLAMILVRLAGPTFSVDVRVLEVRGRWIASADTAHGPSLGLGFTADKAIARALQPFEGEVAELLGSLHRQGLS